MYNFLIGGFFEYVYIFSVEFFQFSHVINVFNITLIHSYVNMETNFADKRKQGKLIIIKFKILISEFHIFVNSFENFKKLNSHK
jgi:hypothetical protein